MDGVARPPIQFLCADGAPCTNMILNNVNLWSATDEATNKCESAFGTGSCLHSGTPTSFAVTTTTIGMPRRVHNSSKLVWRSFCRFRYELADSDPVSHISQTSLHPDTYQVVNQDHPNNILSGAPSNFTACEERVARPRYSMSTTI